MTSRVRPLIAAVCVAILVGSAVTTGQSASQEPSADPKPRPDLVRTPYTPAEVEFMSGMIPHHAQAVLIAGWAASHGARSDVRILCERIVVGQRDEIATMRNWLRDRGLPVPDANATRHKMVMNGMEMDMLMPGMLSDEQLAALDKARGPEWDRLFLTDMIAHHKGALKMVDDLLKTYGAAQDDALFKFVSDMNGDQTIEIDFMTKMLQGEIKREPNAVRRATRTERGVEAPSE